MHSNNEIYHYTCARAMVDFLAFWEYFLPARYIFIAKF